ncbi:MAG: hypothetical protein IIZ44_03260 [Muribaculaceae bacterium]|nr:hypothetical protein [Muribaculaceae bacterium]
MTLNKTHLIVFIVGAVLGLLSGFFIGKGIYDQPIHESVTRDTVTRIDTVSRYYPKPVEVEKTRTEFRWLTRVQTDTVTNYTTLHDSVLVEVPITSKHYNAPEYDAWVSGYMPSLDSIRVYQKERYITETVTISKPPNRFSIGLQGGYGYGFKSKQWEPYIGLGIGIKVF